MSENQYAPCRMCGQQTYNCATQACESEDCLALSERQVIRPSLLRARAMAIYGAYLIRVEVCDAMSGAPIPQATVELNEIETCKAGDMIIDKPLPLLVAHGCSVSSQTDPFGIIYFSISTRELLMRGPRTWVVSATAKDYGIKHAALRYVSLEVLYAQSLMIFQPVQSLSVHEIGEAVPDEFVRLRLPPSNEEASMTKRSIELNP